MQGFCQQNRLLGWAIFSHNLTHLLQQLQQLVPDISRHAVQVRRAVRPVWSLNFDAPDDAVEEGRLVVHPPEVAFGKALHCGHGVSWAEVCSRMT